MLFRDDDVDALGGSNLHQRLTACQLLYKICPGTCGVDHAATAHLQFLAGLQIMHFHTNDPLPLKEHSGDFKASSDDRSILCGGTCESQRMAGIVEDDIVVLQCTSDLITAQ